MKIKIYENSKFGFLKGEEGKDYVISGNPNDTEFTEVVYVDPEKEASERMTNWIALLLGHKKREKIGTLPTEVPAGVLFEGRVDSEYVIPQSTTLSGDSSFTVLKTSDEVIDELNKVLTSQNNADSDSISLYDIEILRRYVREQYNELLDRFTKDMKSKFSRMIKSDSGKKLLDFHVYYFNSEKQFVFCYTIDDCFKRKERIYLIINDNKLQYGPNENYHVRLLSQAIGDSPLGYLDDFMKFDDYFISEKRIRATNCNFDILVDAADVTFGCFPNGYDMCLKNFIFKVPYNNTQQYYKQFYFQDFKTIVNSHAEDLFKNILVKIDDCPFWVRKALDEIGRENLHNFDPTQKESQKKLLLRKKTSKIPNIFG